MEIRKLEFHLIVVKGKRRQGKHGGIKKKFPSNALMLG